ncbi:MAG: enoyl-CoA hydratase/isomerase family protein [Christensenella sp.]|nr:enoyl-CoA hydratase/isomerase family protein [Christensenella sp.]
MKKMNTIRTEYRDNIKWIYLDRPSQLNALNEEMLDELIVTIDEIDKDKDVRCVVITGEGGKAFAAGADIKAMEAMSFTQAREFSVKGRQLMDDIANLAVPVIAAINGFAFGGGLELALACDFRIAAVNARIGLPEVTLGIMPGWDGALRLSRIAGYGYASEVVFSGETLDAKEAERMGIVNRVLPEEALLGFVEDLAHKICKNAPIGIRYAKKCMKDCGADRSKLFGKLFLTADQKTGMNNFNRKCKTEFFEGK